MHFSSEVEITAQQVD